MALNLWRAVLKFIQARLYIRLRQRALCHKRRRPHSKATDNILSSATSRGNAENTSSACGDVHSKIAQVIPLSRFQEKEKEQIAMNMRMG